MTDEPDRRDGPTELVEGEDGELVERLSGGTATLLLVWLIGIGALSTLLAAWAFVWMVTGERLGLGALFGGFGLYTALAGGRGPMCAVAHRPGPGAFARLVHMGQRRRSRWSWWRSSRWR